MIKITRAEESRQMLKNIGQACQWQHWSFYIKGELWIYERTAHCLQEVEYKSRELWEREKEKKPYGDTREKVLTKVEDKLTKWPNIRRTDLDCRP